ncbi:MAG: DivIVA domain-containing protein [Gemmatimonadales bacterium]
MTDDAFHLTSHDVRAQEFSRVLRGYDPSQVDEFKARLAGEIDRLVRERVALDERVKHFGEQLKGFRDRERALNEALIAAQQLRADSQANAEREAEVVLREARTDAEKIRMEARSEAQRLLEQTRAEEQRLVHANEMARRQLTAYLMSVRQLLERHLHEIQVLSSADGLLPETPEAPIRRKA